MKIKKIITFLVLFLSIGIISTYAQPTLHLNGRSANAELFTVTGDYNTITVSASNGIQNLSNIRIDYYIGSNYYSEIITPGSSFCISGITSFTLSCSVSYISTGGYIIYNAYETEMYAIY